MPTYQYTCTECGTPLEVVQSFTDATLTECPTCGGRLRKVFSAVGVVFKGSGFYRTDSRDEKKPAPVNGAKDTSSGDGTSSGKDAGPAKSDTAAAAAKDSSAPAKDKPAASTSASSSSSGGSSQASSGSKPSSSSSGGTSS